MDDRKKRIDDLFRNSEESRASLDTLLENLGHSLYVRAGEMQAGFEDIDQYKGYLREIAELNAAIVKIEEKNRRFKELEAEIEKGEHEEKERNREMDGIYRRLGKALLENPSYSDYTSLFKEQADSLSAKLESLETRIGELENKEGGNVFSWIGKSAQGLVLKSFLTKAQESQEQLFHNIGERYSGRESVKEDDDVALIRADIDRLRGVSRAAQDEIAVLKDEKRMISAGFGIDGNPQKQIQSVQNQIAQIEDNLRHLYRRFGMQASGIDEEIAPERKYFIDTIVTAEDSEIIGRAVRLNQSLTDNDKAIAKLRASLAIDEEKAKIEKSQRMIEEKKNKISELDIAISDLENGIRESEAYITELQKQL